jgi:hypothetical protein
MNALPNDSNIIAPPLKTYGVIYSTNITAALPLMSHISAAITIIQPFQLLSTIQRLNIFPLSSLQLPTSNPFSFHLSATPKDYTTQPSFPFYLRASSFQSRIVPLPGSPLRFDFQSISPSPSKSHNTPYRLSTRLLILSPQAYYPKDHTALFS